MATCATLCLRKNSNKVGGHHEENVNLAVLRHDRESLAEFLSVCDAEAVEEFRGSRFGGRKVGSTCALYPEIPGFKPEHQIFGLAFFEFFFFSEVHILFGYLVIFLQYLFTWKFCGYITLKCQ